MFANILLYYSHKQKLDRKRFERRRSVLEETLQTERQAPLKRLQRNAGAGKLRERSVSDRGEVMSLPIVTKLSCITRNSAEIE